MKCKFEHGGCCCNSGCLRYKTTCYPELCGCVVPTSHGDAFRAQSDEELAEFLSSVVSPMDCPKRVWDLYDSILSYKDAWLKWLEEPCE